MGFRNRAGRANETRGHEHLLEHAHGRIDVEQAEHAPEIWSAQIAYVEALVVGDVQRYTVTVLAGKDLSPTQQEIRGVVAPGNPTLNVGDTVAVQDIGGTSPWILPGAGTGTGGQTVGNIAVYGFEVGGS